MNNLYFNIRTDKLIENLQNNCNNVFTNTQLRFVNKIEFVLFKGRAVRTHKANPLKLACRIYSKTTKFNEKYKSKPTSL